MANKLRLLIFMGALSFASFAPAQTATINWGTTYQTIQGFGASIGTNYSDTPWLSSTQTSLLFGTLGFSILREFVPDNGDCSSVNASCAGDYPDAQAAAAFGARVYASSISPPASMKTNGSTICNTGSGDGSLSSDSYGSFANYLSNYIASAAAQGINLYAISVQNEPDYCPTTYDGAAWTAGEFDTFVKNNLGPTLANAGQSGVLVMLPESSLHSSLNSEGTNCMTDSACYNYIGINAWHDYDASWNPPNAASNPWGSLGKQYWETEVSAFDGVGPSLCGGCWDPSMADGLLWAAIIDDRVAVENANAWVYWLFVGYTSDNQGLLYEDGVTTSKRMFVMGNYSKFVRPGWLRVDATHSPTAGVTVSAYKDPASGNFAIIATNQNASNMNVTFNFNGVTVNSATPWVTSASLNLVGQTGVQVTSNMFNIALPAQSVTTFVGTAASNPPPAPTITCISVNSGCPSPNS
jgi:glucuronoarabinoxylan endo-1,4-beta-xylanase